jgi:hypothetical protein
MERDDEFHECYSTEGGMFSDATGSTARKMRREINGGTKSNHWAAPHLKLLVAGFPPRRPRFEHGSGQVGFVVDKVALGQVFSEYFGFAC